MLLDMDDRIVVSNEINTRLFNFIDFDRKPSYAEAFLNCIAHGRFTEPDAYEDPQKWLSGALQFRRAHRFAQFIKCYPDGRSYMVTYETIPEIGSYFSRIEVTDVLRQQRSSGTLFGPQIWAGLVPARATLVTGALGSMGAAAAVVTTTGLLVDANAAMTGLLAGRDGLSEIGGRITAARPREHDTLLRLLAATVGAEGEQPLVMRVTREGVDAPYLVHVSPCALPFGQARVALATLIVVDPSAEPQVAPGVMAALFGLTAAEARVAVELGRGLRVEDVAERHGTSPQTVRTQLKAVFSKAGLSRQVELVRLISQLSAFFRPILKR
ncbi:hypothetical protein ABAZ39_13115 [Azospirillum argentinense]|uniref:HTH luxR-type domain-containing protein n=1 Tax=Azospirillum argentinense TaxID=2970906 RepID=A0A060DJI0_9PROT|nr:helix-turn-helix transcriptional regulator [Azospirillum argentinense]AIB12910.1 hypothetical protein ABAZ39_13115 [Azospirillum argentinense]EZQ09901.1 hypothetical protein ABAZ39_14525 [Azospirillum argentinense]